MIKIQNRLFESVCNKLISFAYQVRTIKIKYDE